MDIHTHMPSQPQQILSKFSKAPRIRWRKMCLSEMHDRWVWISSIQGKTQIPPLPFLVIYANLQDTVQVISVAHYWTWLIGTSPTCRCGICISSRGSHQALTQVPLLQSVAGIWRQPCCLAVGFFLQTLGLSRSFFGSFCCWWFFFFFPRDTESLVKSETGTHVLYCLSLQTGLRSSDSCRLRLGGFLTHPRPFQIFSSSAKAVLSPAPQDKG